MMDGPNIATADLIARYYRHEIGRLMQQAEHWAAHNKPLAVHHRVTKADNYYQVVVLFERFRQWNENPFEKMRDDLSRGHLKPPGTWPPTMTINRYRDPVFVASQLCQSKSARPSKNKFEIDGVGADKVTAIIEQVRAAGLEDAAKTFETIYWGWLRFVGAYVNGHPYVSNPEPGMTPLSALHVADYTLNHWAPQIPGSPQLDDKGVLDEAAADEAWHREEDRRMRRASGEEI